jgi:tricorn protease-like protein
MFRGSKMQLRTRPVRSPASFVDDIALHPNGHSLALLSRGRLFDMALWEGPAVQAQLSLQVLRATFLSDGRLVLLTLPVGGSSKKITVDYGYLADWLLFWLFVSCGSGGWVRR